MIGRWIVVWSRGLRSEPIRSIGVVGLILVTAFIASSVPRVLARASDNALHEEVGAAGSTVRDLELVQVGRIATSEPDPMRLVETAGDGLESRYPAPIPAVIAAGGFVVDTPLWHPNAGTSLDSVLDLRIQQDVDAHIRLVAGRLPTAATKTISDPTPGASKDSQLVVLEAATSSQIATKLGLPIGGRLILQPEPSDPLAANRGVRLAVDLVGTYEVIDPADPYWLNDQSVARSYIYALQKQVEYVGATMLLAPEEYPALMGATLPSGLPMTYRWRSYVDPAAIQSTELEALSDALRRAETTYPPANPSLSAIGGFSGPDQMSPASLQTGLLGLITAHQARWQAGATILTILWTGAGLVILASVALVAEVIARRRRIALAIVGRRGASPSQVGAAILSESAILVLPAALFGTILAIVLIPVTDQGATFVVASAVTLGAVGLIAAASRGTQSEGVPDRAGSLRRAGSGRLVAEALVVGLAVVGAILLRGRSGGQAASGSSGTPGGVAAVGADPFLAAAPALVGLAAGIVAVRLLPLILGLLARLLARRRGLIAVLGFRRASRDGSVAAVLVVALTATTIGAFASALLDQIDAGARSASWQTVGANFQLAGSPASLAAFQAKHLAGVDATATISTLNVGVSTGGARSLVVVDPAAVAVAAAGTPAEPIFPAAMLGPAASPIPAIVSSAAEGSNPIGVDQTFSVRIGGVAVQLRAVAVRDAYPSIPAGVPFVVVSSAQLALLSPTDVPPPTAILARAPTLSLAEVQAAVVDLLGVTIQGQAVSEVSLRDAPAVAAVSLGILSAAIAVLVYGLLTIILAIALDTASRRRETARLQILGLSNRQALTLVVVEFAPAVVVGVLAGVGLGLGLINFVGPGLGLPAVLGVAAVQSSTPDIGRLVGLASATLALILGATLLSTVLERQTQLATAVRD